MCPAKVPIKARSRIAPIPPALSSIVSPGITVSLQQTLQAYAVLQVPVYSNLDGYQLFPHWTATVGLSYAF